MLTQPSVRIGQTRPSRGKVLLVFARWVAPARPINTLKEHVSMVDQEPGAPRPRRAFIEPDPVPAPPDDLDDDERPKPLYRDEVDGPAATVQNPPAKTPSGPAPAADAVSELEDTGSRPINFTPRRRPKLVDDDATTILPRTTSATRREADLDEIDDDERSPMAQRTKTALLIGAAVAVAVVGLAIFYAVTNVSSPQTTPPASPSANATSTDPTGSGDPTAVTALLTDDAILDLADAKLVVGSRDWEVARTDQTPTEDAPQAACFTPDPVDGQPAPQQQVLRLLSSSGKDAPGLLHQASAYATPEDAAQAYAIAAKTIGTCGVTGSYIVSGQSVSGLGDQSAGVVVGAVDGSQTQLHTVIINRTGRVLNIIDATQPKKAVSAESVVKASAAVTGRQCTTAGGPCPSDTSVSDGPPPVGGDAPGFLAAGDLPPVGNPALAWGAIPPELPKDDFFGSKCETTKWTTLSTEETTSRTYIPDNSTVFGLNQIIVTLKDDEAADKLVAKFKSDLGTCSKRQLTAKVSTPDQVSGVGAQKTKVEGWAAEVAQKTGAGTTRYRVGMVAAGSKVTYTFLNPQDAEKLDFTDDQWKTVVVRAGMRTTQVN